MPTVRRSLESPLPRANSFGVLVNPHSTALFASIERTIETEVVNGLVPQTPTGKWNESKVGYSRQPSKLGPGRVLIGN